MKKTKMTAITSITMTNEFITFPLKFKFVVVYPKLLKSI